MASPGQTFLTRKDLNMKIVTLVVLLFASYSGADQRLHAQAPYESPANSGNVFLRMCSVVEKEKTETLEETRNVLVCMAFVDGAGGGAIVGAGYAEGVTGKLNKMLYPFCLPEKVEKGQTVSIVLKYIRNHPERAQEFTAFLVVDALHQAFPCKQ
jgi:hypothetical protein